MEIEDLAQKADLVAVVRVERVETMIEPDGSFISTRTHLLVERAIAGSVPQSGRANVIVLGGQVPGVSMAYPGARFAQGERRIVFLENRRDHPGDMQVVGEFQGAFRLMLEEETGMEIAVFELLTTI